jgi:glycosyltransferase involved in cell wall biosynthesis
MLKVSCIMPACYGEVAAVAISCFIAQTYENRELVVLDNNPAGSTIEHLIPKGDPRFVYAQCERTNTGALRNQANALATGDVLCHWDCDDWYSADRVSYQIDRLRLSEKAMTGFHSILFYNTADGRCYRYTFAGTPPYACGTSAFYTRSWWLEHPFREISRGEDFYFQLEAAQAGRLDSAPGAQLGVARGHRDSTCPPQFGCSQLPQVKPEALPPEFWVSISAIPVTA